MECVQKTSCDFEGFITEEEFVITPDLEMLRVPLIVRKFKRLFYLILSLSLSALREQSPG